jgi:hypothetical protein
MTPPIESNVAKNDQATMPWATPELPYCPVPPTTGEPLREYIANNEPNFCECARVAKRPLSWAFWSDWFSDNRVLDSQNKEFSHSHIIFEGSGDNIGFGPDGLFAEDYKKFDYHLEPECYDGQKMREAIKKADEPSFYGFIMSNCQSYVDKLLKHIKLL